MSSLIAAIHWRHGFFLNAELKAGKGHGIELSLAPIAMALAIIIEKTPDRSRLIAGWFIKRALLRASAPGSLCHRVHIASPYRLGTGTMGAARTR